MELSDDELAAELARGAGEVLMAVRHGELLRGSLLGDLGDAMAQAWIAQVLREHRYGDAVLSEEAEDSPRRLGAERVWIIDPLDGTANYCRHSPEFAVHIALVEAGIPITAAVGLPVEGAVIRSDTVPAPTGPPTGLVVASRYRVSPRIRAMSSALGLDLVSMGSAGFKAMEVVRGRADAYVHEGGQFEWDSCAPVGVALAAGLHCSRIDGTALRYNNPSPYLPDVLICRPELADPILEQLAR